MDIRLGAASSRAALMLALLALCAGLVAVMPRLLGPTSGFAIVGDAVPWAAVLLAWEWRTLRAPRHADQLWALPTDLFREGVAVGGVSVVLTSAALRLLERQGDEATTIVIAKTIEDILYGLGIVALGSLAAFALTRTVVRPALRDRLAPGSARDISLRTRFLVIATGASFATAGVLLEVLVDFELTPQSTLSAYLVLAAALVAFASLIGWLVGVDTARGVSTIAQRLHEVAGVERAGASPPRLAADEIGGLAVAAMEVERRIRVNEARAAAAAERDRIARELHDGVAKSVSVIALEAATTAARASDDVRPQLARIQRLARLLSEELRAIVTDVRARDEATPFADMLRTVAERHAPVDFGVQGDLERVGTLARFEVLRIVDEALTNAERHAGAAHVIARVAVSADRVCVNVEDDGVGLRDVEWKSLPRSGRFGLIGIRERAQLLGGAVRIEQGPLGGTLLQVEFPLASS